MLAARTRFSDGDRHAWTRPLLSMPALSDSPAVAEYSRWQEADGSRQWITGFPRERSVRLFDHVVDV